MKETEKMISVTAVVTVAASLLTGCGSSGGSGVITATETRAAKTMTV